MDLLSTSRGQQAIQNSIVSSNLANNIQSVHSRSNRGIIIRNTKVFGLHFTLALTIQHRQRGWMSGRPNIYILCGKYVVISHESVVLLLCHCNSLDLTCFIDLRGLPCCRGCCVNVLIADGSSNKLIRTRTIQLNAIFGLMKSRNAADGIIHRLRALFICPRTGEQIRRWQWICGRCSGGPGSEIIKWGIF